MSKENQPLPYERRIRDTKSLAQRLDLNYIYRRHWFRTLRRGLAWGLAAAAAAVSIPMILGVGGSEKAFVNGPMSRSHRLFEARCELCHRASFVAVRDEDCKACHDGPAHKANVRAEPRCSECHSEHRGTVALASMSSRHCTGCHGDLAAHATGLKTKNVKITGFGAGRHPEFAVAGQRDERPIKLNHAAHLPAQGKVVGEIKLPMKCGDCHQIDASDRNGGMAPMTFEKHCANCHRRELEFDVYGVLGGAPPAPHAKDPEAIRRFVRAAYEKALAADPGLARKPLRPDVEPPATAAGWLAAAVGDSEHYLFRKKCVYCHEVEGWREGLPVIAKVGALQGRYDKARGGSERWLPGAQFGHRAHRMVECGSCHGQARESRKSSDVLVAGMSTCAACHGAGAGGGLDQCAQCHLYHDKTKERERDRLSIDEILSARAHGHR